MSRTDEGEIGTTIRRLLAAHLPEGVNVLALPADTMLALIGLDSMRSINLLLDLEDQLGVAFPDEMIVPANFATIASIEVAVAHVLVRSLK